MDELGMGNEAALKHRLRYTVDLRIPGFLHSVPPGTVGQRTFEDCSTIEWYRSFVERLTSAIGRKYLPVFRMSDGEFYFSVGYRPPRPPTGVSRFWHYFRTGLGLLRVGRLPGCFRSGMPQRYWEEFYFFEWYKLRKEFVVYLRQIAEAGIFAVNFTVTEPPFAEQYLNPFCDWMDKNGIALTPANYYPFYFVYALLNGPDRARLYDGKRILVVTSLNEAKKTAIAQALENEGAVGIEFIPVSPNKAMKDRIDLATVQDSVDLVLVGAGVGASSALVQLEPLQTLCIDAGFCLDILVDPKRSLSRLFCEPDITASEEFESDGLA